MNNLNNLPYELIEKILNYNPPDISNKYVCKSFNTVLGRHFNNCECNKCKTIYWTCKKGHLNCFKYVIKWQRWRSFYNYKIIKYACLNDEILKYLIRIGYINQQRTFIKLMFPNMDFLNQNSKAILQTRTTTLKLQ